MRLTGTVVGVCALAAVLSSCSGSKSSTTPGSAGNSSGSGSAGASDASSGSSGPSGSGSPSDSVSSTGSSGSGGPGGNVVNNGTLTFALNADPGNLDPQGSATSNTFQITQFAYDNLVSQDANGKIQSQLASAWKVNGNKVVLTIKKGVTCADGAPFTAADVVTNINYVANPKNKSPFLGVYLPAGAKASADAAASTVTLTAPKAPFVLNGLASLPMVCAKGIKDRKSLARHTDGTGAYQLSEAVSGDHYTYTKRSGYTWGPNGATTDEPGMPSKVVVKVVTNETTAVNLFLSGGINVLTVLGADVQRVEAARLFSADVPVVAGEMWFNHTKGRPGADEAVRQAMIRAVDLTQLAKVLTSGRGTPGTTFAAIPPTPCPGNSIAAVLPPSDPAKAKQLLDTAGWKVGPGGTRAKNGTELAITFAYDTAAGAGGSAAAEQAVQAWKLLGMKVTSKPQDETAMNTTIFSTGNWDVVWEPLNVSSPDQIVPFLSGPAPGKGTNFAHIQNPRYNALQATASTLTGSAGCGDWLKAEAELVKSADVIPFANLATKTFGNHARFVIAGSIVPTSLRLLNR